MTDWNEVIEKCMKDYTPLRVGVVFRDPVAPVSFSREDMRIDRKEDVGAPETVDIPVGMIDSLRASAMEAPSLEFHSLLSRGYMAWHRFFKIDGDYFFKSDIDYLEAGLAASSRVSVELYAYLPGKSGCCTVLCLGDGSRRISTAYHLALLGRENRRINCSVDALYFLDVAKAEALKEELQEKLEKEQTFFCRFMDRLRRLKRKLFGYDIWDDDREPLVKLFGIYQQIGAIEAAIDYQKRSEPVIESILKVLEGKAGHEDYKRIYESFNPFVWD